MNLDKIARIEHLALYSNRTLEDFCKEFRMILNLPEMIYDYENETEWMETDVDNIHYNVSRPYEEGTLQEWDNSVPQGCNIGVSIGIYDEHHHAKNPEWLYENIVRALAIKISAHFKTEVFYHSSWLGPGRYEVSHEIFCY